jgi:hypothetical protein
MDGLPQVFPPRKPTKTTPWLAMDLLMQGVLRREMEQRRRIEMAEIERNKPKPETKKPDRGGFGPRR